MGYWLCPGESKSGNTPYNGKDLNKMNVEMLWF